MSSDRPLAGRRIVVTRTRDQAGNLTEALARRGASVIELPTIEIVPPDSYEAIDAALINIDTYQWLIVTSANTVRVIRERMKALSVDTDDFEKTKVVAIGSATAAALQDAGLPVDLIPERAVGESVVDSLRDRVRGHRVLLARASVARDVIPAELAIHGAKVDIVETYKTAIPIESVAKLAEQFDPTVKPPHAVTFTSSSTVQHFFRLLGEAGIAIIPKGVSALSIGPITSATLREFGWEPAAEATQSDVPGMVDAAVRALAIHIVRPT
jgi:uroporphyrinogen-III synthase